MTRGVTPSQTIGPFLAIGLPWPDGPEVVGPGAARRDHHHRPGAGRRRGAGAGRAGGDLAGGAGRQLRPPRRPARRRRTRASGPSGAAPPTAAGDYRIVTLRPGALPAPGGGTEAPHLDVTVFARGLLDRVVTRIYFADEAAANAADPVLAVVPEDRRGTLIAVPPPGGPPGTLPVRHPAAGAAGDGVLRCLSAPVPEETVPEETGA